MEPLNLSGHRRLEFTLAGGDGPDDPGEFVGDSNHGLVVSRERWTFRAQARSLSGGLLLTFAARSTARPPWVRSIRR